MQRITLKIYYDKMCSRLKRKKKQYRIQRAFKLWFPSELDCIEVYICSMRPICSLDLSVSVSRLTVTDIFPLWNIDRPPRKTNFFQCRLERCLLLTVERRRKNKRHPGRERKGRVSSVASSLTFGSTAGGDSESCSLMPNDVQKRVIAP